MRKINEILRLKYEVGLSNRAVARTCKISNSTVGLYLHRAEKANICWPLEAITENELYKRLFPEEYLEKATEQFAMPNWEEIHKERKRKGVTLQLLWQEYKENNTNAYQYSQFCEHYRRWKKSQSEPTLRKEHIGGNEMEVDYAGMKIAIIDRMTGEIHNAVVFVAILPASNYCYAEAQWNANQ